MPKRKRPSTRASNGAAVDHARHHQEQQRQHDAQSSNEAGASRSRTSKKAKKNKKAGSGKKTRRPLNGLTLAVTALDEKRAGDREEEADDATCSTSPASSSSSYKRTIEKCTEHGATITRQVHRRVHALIVSDVAVQNASQRVRKAIKLRIPIVDVGWIEACADSGRRVEWTEYLRDDEAREAAQAKEAANRDAGIGISAHGCDVKFDVGEDDANAASGWTDAVELDCCCVCHENGDLECPWCTGDKECNLTKRRLGI